MSATRIGGASLVGNNRAIESELTLRALGGMPFEKVLRVSVEERVELLSGRLAGLRLQIAEVVRELVFLEGRIADMREGKR